MKKQRTQKWKMNAVRQIEREQNELPEENEERKKENMKIIQQGDEESKKKKNQEDDGEETEKEIARGK